MVLKIFKAVWFLSLLAWLVVFLYVYASLHEEDVLIREEGSRLLISREALFYLFLSVIALFTAVTLAMAKLLARQEDFLTWYYGLIICFHFFFMIVLNFINLINSGENFAYDRIGYIIYGSLGLLGFWAIGWPVYSIFRKFLSKEAV